MKDTIIIKPKGHLRIYEKETGKVLLDDHNEINPENFSYAIATSLAGLENDAGYCYGNIGKMVFGNGGARVTSTNKYIYSVPQTIGRSATLYNQVYEKNIRNESDEDNYINVTHALGNNYSDIIIHCTLDKITDGTTITVDSDTETSSESAISSTSNGTIINDLTFSGVGLVSGGGDLLPHICFFPVQWSQNTTLVFEYVVRIQIN